jgi:hypothetical protein
MVDQNVRTPTQAKLERSHPCATSCHAKWCESRVTQVVRQKTICVSHDQFVELTLFWPHSENLGFTAFTLLFPNMHKYFTALHKMMNAFKLCNTL